MHYNWNWGIFWEQSPDGIPYIDTLMIGLKWTLATAVLAWIMALALGTIVGTIRTTQKPWAVRLANGYVELFRNIPLLVQMFLWYFVMPELVPAALGDWLKSLPNASFVTAFLALGFFTSSRVAVQVSTGINALPRGQRMAGAALGLTPVQTYRYVLLPMAFRIIIPALTNEFAAIIKNSSVALTIGLVELTAATYSMREFTFRCHDYLHRHFRDCAVDCAHSGKGDCRARLHYRR
jgi:glutamate/aspartate transport system permease protein